MSDKCELSIAVKLSEKLEPVFAGATVSLRVGCFLSSFFPFSFPFSTVNSYMLLSPPLVSNNVVLFLTRAAVILKYMQVTQVRLRWHSL